MKSEKSMGSINSICNVLYFYLGNEYLRFVSFSLFNIVLLISSSFNESLFVFFLNFTYILNYSFASMTHFSIEF